MAFRRHSGEGGDGRPHGRRPDREQRQQMKRIDQQRADRIGDILHFAMETFGRRA